MVSNDRRSRWASRLRTEGGFTFMELLIASAVTIATMGVAVQVASQVQQGYTRQMDASAYEEEARFAIDWIVRALRQAGSNPYGITVSNCPAAGTAFVPLRLDPNANGLDDDVRIHADVGQPNALLGGDAGACTEADEDLTIALDTANRTITRQDNNLDAAPVAMTDGVITGLQFTYLDAARAVTANPAAVAFVSVAVTAQSTTANAQTGLFDTITLSSEVRLRSR